MSLGFYLKAQEEKQNIDPSKPTNLYTQVNALAEFIDIDDGAKLYGTRFNVQYTFNPDNLLLLEAPFVYNDQTEKFGLGNMRIRYYRAAKRNLSKTVIAIAPFADVTLPTGSSSKGLGGGRWSFAVGSVVGLVLNEKLSLFPGASYVHVTKHKDDLPGNDDANGVGLQTNASLKLGTHSFVFINPVYTYLNSNGDWNGAWSGELNFNYIVIPNKFKTNAGWYPNFTNDINEFRVGATVYF